MGATMSKTILEAIAELKQEIEPVDAELNKKKETVNTLCGLAGLPPAYSITVAGDQAQAIFSFRSDEFYGEPLASSARRVLEQSKAAGRGAIDLDALYDALKAGGFAFDAQNDRYARRSLAISLAKNSQTFARLPNGDYGLRRWYKKGAPRRSLIGGAGIEEAADDTEETLELGTDDVIVEMSDDELREALDGNSGPAMLPAPAGPDDDRSETEDWDR